MVLVGLAVPRSWPLGDTRSPSKRTFAMPSQWGCSVDGGLHVRCRPSDGLLIVGGLPVVGKGVACVLDELGAPEFHG